MKIVFVGFKVKQDRSVMYKKIEITDNTIKGVMSDPTVSFSLGKPLQKAIEKDCDFVSIRFCRNEKEN